MAEPDYRDLILERLCKRDRFVAQFSRIIDSYASISESLNVVLSSDKRRKYDSPVGGDAAKEIQDLKSELADLYKKRSINDQQLIDAQKKIVDLEARLAAVLETKGELEHQLKELREQLRQKEQELRDKEQEKQVLGDEVIALHALNNSLNKKFLEADNERVQLINNIKEMKEHQIDLLNELNDLEDRKRLQRLRSEIDEAIKPSSSKENLERKPSVASSVGSCSTAGAFDELPTRCFYKMEADDAGEVNDCCFNKGGNMFFTAGNDKIVRIYQLHGERAHLTAKLTGFSSAVNRLHVHGELPLILAASNDRTVRVYSLDDQRLKCALTGHSDKVSSAKFLSHMNRIVSGSLDRTVKVWDSFSVRCIKTFFPGSIVTDVAVAEGAQLFVSSHYDKHIRFWDSRTENAVSSIKLDGKITSLSLSTDQTKLLCCCRDETLSLFDIRARHVEHIYSADSYRTSYDYCKCLISPAMNYVLAGSAEGQIFIWNLHSTKLEKVLQRGGHEGAPVYALAYHPTERLLISTDRRKTCCLWD